MPSYNEWNIILLMCFVTVLDARAWLYGEDCLDNLVTLVVPSGYWLWFSKPFGVTSNLNSFNVWWVGTEPTTKHLLFYFVTI